MFSEVIFNICVTSSDVDFIFWFILASALFVTVTASISVVAFFTTATIFNVVLFPASRLTWYDTLLSIV